MLTKKKFRCKRCGECCKKYLVKLYSDDIRKIKKSYPLEYFIDKIITGKSNGYILKKINGRCVFLKLKNNQYFCEIHPIRPKICRQYPFFGRKIESCKPVTIESMVKVAIPQKF